MGNDSKIQTDLAVDDALLQDANYRFTPAERQYIDNQIRGTQQHLVDSLIRGRHATWFDLDAAYDVVAGDTVCLASTLDLKVTKSVGEALTDAKSVLGVVVQAASASTRVLVARGGILPPSITGLPDSSGYARVNTATSQCERVASLDIGDYGIGTVDASGNLHVIAGYTRPETPGDVEETSQTTATWASVVRSRISTSQTTTATTNQVIESGAAQDGEDFVLSDNALTRIALLAMVKKSSTSSGGTVEVKADYIRNGGAPTLIGIVDITYNLSGSSLDATTVDLHVNGNRVELRASPESADTLNWTVIRTQTEGAG